MLNKKKQKNVGLLDNHELEALQEKYHNNLDDFGQELYKMYRNDTFKFMLKQKDISCETVKSFKNGLSATYRQIQKGYQVIKWMYTTTFITGIGLIIFSIAYALYTNGSILSIAFAGVGTSELITVFISNPPQKLQDTQANLAQLEAALYNWFADVFDFNYQNELGWTLFALAELNTNPESIKHLRSILDDSKKNLEKVSAMRLTNTENIVGLIGKYCGSQTKSSNKSIFEQKMEFLDRLIKFKERGDITENEFNTMKQQLVAEKVG